MSKKWTAKRIKALRASMDLSQDAFSKLIGTTQNYVYMLEAGLRVPSPTLELLLDCVESRRERR